MPSSARDGPFTMSIGNTLDVVVVSPNAFHSGVVSASSAARTSGNAAGCTPAIAAFAATSSTVATPYCGGSTPSTWSGGSGVRASSASIASSVGGRQRRAVAPPLGERSLVERVGVGGDLDLGAGQRHGRRPEELQRLRVELGRDRQQVGVGTRLEGIGEDQDREIAVAEVLGHVVPVGGELLGDHRDHRSVVLLDRDRVGDGERRARPAGAESDDGEVDRGREVGDVAAVGRAGVADLRVGLDGRDAGDAVGPQALLPVGGDEPPRAPGGVGADAGAQPGDGSVEPEGGRGHLLDRRGGGTADHHGAHAATVPDPCVRIQC